MPQAMLLGEPNHTREEMQEALTKMNSAVNSYYGMAVGTGCHAFIEFTGFLNEWVRICAENMEDGIDFLDADQHSGAVMKMHAYQAEYLAEKFKCVFGPTLENNPKARAAFMKVFDAPDDGT